MQIFDLDTLNDLCCEELLAVAGGVTVIGPQGLVRLLENEEKDAPGLTPEKGQKISSNTNGEKKGWIEGTVPGH